jgi:xylulokinase
VVDVGTSALKAVLFGSRGETLASVSVAIATRSTGDGLCEQDPGEWWAALGAAVSALPDSHSVSAVALSGSMQNLIALRADGSPAGPAILYSDRRLDDGEIGQLGACLPDDYAQRTGNRLDPAHTILKLMARQRFLADGQPFQWTFGAKDALSLRLTGEAVIDPTTASTTGLMHLASRRWDTELLAIAEVGEASLPRIAPADAMVGRLTPKAAGEIGLPAGIPIFNGSGDAGAATWVGWRRRSTSRPPRRPARSTHWPTRCDPITPSSSRPS